jgi:hypothetical protein
MRRGRPRKYKQIYRNPPMPAWFYNAPWGTCRWCNKPILKEDGTINTRRRWHPTGCLHDYLIIADHKYAKRQVKKRDKGICASCGKYCHYRHEWQLDHIRPLIEAKGDLSFWRMGNLATRCNTCHFLKSAQENSDRAKLRKIA